MENLPQQQHDKNLFIWDEGIKYKGHKQSPDSGGQNYTGKTLTICSRSFLLRNFFFEEAITRGCYFGSLSYVMNGWSNNIYYPFYYLFHCSSLVVVS